VNIKNIIKSSILNGLNNIYISGSYHFFPEVMEDDKLYHSICEERKVPVLVTKMLGAPECENCLKRVDEMVNRIASIIDERA
jgi:hypothetical protein